MAPRPRPIRKGQVVTPLRSDSESPPPLRRRPKATAEDLEHSDVDGSGYGQERASAYARDEESDSERDARPASPYKDQGRTSRSQPFHRAHRYSDEEEDRSDLRSQHSVPSFTAPRTPTSRQSRPQDDSDDEMLPRGRPERVANNLSKSTKGARTPDINRAYISPPPTQRKPLRVPDTPRGRVPHHSSLRTLDSRQESPQRRHDVYAVTSSDEDAAIRIRTKKRKPPPPADVLDISTGDELPARITPRKLKFADVEVAVVQDGDYESDRASAAGDEDDVDEDGNLRDFIAPDDEDVYRTKTRRDSRKSDPRLSKSVPNPHEDAGAEEEQSNPHKADSEQPDSDDGHMDHEAASIRPGGSSVSGRGQGHIKNITVTTYDGRNVDLKYRARDSASDSLKRKAFSPSRDNDVHGSVQKQASKSVSGRRPVPSELKTRARARSDTPSEDEYVTPVKRTRKPVAQRSPSPLKAKRRARSPTPYDSEDAKPAKRVKKQSPTQARRSPSPPVPSKRTKRKDRSPTPSDREDKNSKRVKAPSRSALRASPSPVKTERSPRKQSAPSQTATSRPLVKDNKCRITFEGDHDGFLVGTSNMLRTPQQTGAVGVSHFGSTHNGLAVYEDDNVHIKRLRATITCVNTADGQVLNAARADSDEFRVGLTSFTTKFNKTIQTASRDGEAVDLVIFGFVAPDGSFLERLAVPAGDNPNNQAFHALHIFPLNGEYQRTLAFLHRVFAPANQQCQMFTPDNAWVGGTLWADRDKYQNKKALPGHVVTNPGEGSSARSRGVHPALNRSARNHLSDIPIFDSRRHFMASHVGEDWSEGFSPERILSQVDGLDERFKGEIPDDSFVAMHCVASMRNNGVVSLNLIGAQVLVTPRVVHFSDL